MDPLSISVAVVALVDLCAKTMKYLREVKESSKECNLIKAEIRSTEAILRTFMEIVEDAESKDEDWSATIRSVTAKGGPVEELQVAFTALLKLAESLAGGGAKGFGKSLLWPLKSDEVRELLKRIDRQKSLLMMAVQNDHLSLSKEIQAGTHRLRLDMVTVKEAVHRLGVVQDDKECQEVVGWLGAMDCAPRFNDFIGRHQEGTGQWLLESKEFADWVSRRQQTLFCPGMPGAGKTMIASIVINHLFQRFQDDFDVAVAYLYCDARRHHEQKPVDLLLSLLKQLVQAPRGQSSIPDAVLNLWIRHKSKRTRPSFDEILLVLEEVAEEIGSLYIVVDALDECQVSDLDRAKFLSALSQVQAKSGGNLFVTSRFIPSIQSIFEESFEGCRYIVIRASSSDVRRYIEGHMPELPSFVSRNVELQTEIKERIVTAVDGMFLLARLHLGSLLGKRSPKAIRTALSKLPAGTEGYDRAYDDAMKRIQGQVPDSCELAKQVLSWIICAERPLSPSELQHALAVEMDEIELDEENLPELDDMISVCGGLVTVESTSNTVRMVHYTAQEYFDRTRKTWFPEAPAHVALTCATYMLFDAF